MIKYLIVLIFTVQLLNAQIDTLWTKIFNDPGGGFDEPKGIVVDLYGNAYVTGTVSNAGDEQDIGTVKYSSDGIWQWTSFYAGPVDIDDAMAIAIDDSGKYVYVAGYIQKDEIGFDYDWVIIKIDAANGDTLWTREYGMPNFFEAPTHIAVGHSDDIYVVGMAQSVSSPGYSAFTTRKYDKYGNFLGMAQDLEMPWSQPEAIFLDDDENVYITGGQGNHTGTYTCKYNKFLALQWLKATADTNARERRAFAMTVDNSGNVYIVGFCNGSWHGMVSPPSDTIPDYFILSYDPSGTPRYWKEYSCPPQDSSDAATGVVVDDVGQFIYVTGFGNGRTSSLRDIWTMKIETATGDTVWTRKFDGPAGGNEVTAGWNDFEDSPLTIPIVMNPAENLIYIAGSTEEVSSSDNDYLLIAYDTDGNLFDSHTLDIGYDDEPEEIAMGPAGNPYVTGCGEVMFFLDDFLTVKYFLSGAYPPISPYIYVEKTAGKDSVVVYWDAITEDTLGNPLTIDHYSIYGSNDPSFIPGPANFIVDVTDTFFKEPVPATTIYYLVFATSTDDKTSKKSNMGYKFNKFVNENSGITSDRNWTSLPWHNEYTTVSDLTTDLSPTGDPLIEVTNLRDDQLYENYTYIPGFGWLGIDFLISSGCGYELVTVNDTDVVLVGSNNPDGLVSLNENPGLVSDRNWVSIPCNAIYSVVSDITTEYSSVGDPLVEVTNLRDDQLYENYTYIPGFGWLGNDFLITAGRGYEFVTITDTTWNPTEYTNRAKGELAANKGRGSDLEVYLGKLTEPERVPVWLVCDLDCNTTGLHLKKKIDFSDADVYKPVTEILEKKDDYREPGISHIVFVYVGMQDLDNFVFTPLDSEHPTRFTAYRPDQPYDVLTENVIGCGFARNDSRGVLWFNTGNFRRPWQDSEEVILIIEGTKKGRGYFSILNFKLDKGVDIQDLGEISFIPIPGPESWDEIDNNNIVGYSIYQGDKRLNERVITRSEYSAGHDITLKPVIRGGYETVYSAQGIQAMPGDKTPIVFAFNIYPNPFTKRTGVNYALPHSTQINIKVYDVCGKLVKTLVSERLEPGYYRAVWSGDDNLSRKVSAGVYFIQLDAQEFDSQRKVIMVH